MISVSTAGAAGTLRVQVWRKLRSLGALYLQQSVCLLPARRPGGECGGSADRVRHQGGTARVLTDGFADPAEEHAVVEEFNAARDAEYAEVLERLPALRRELAEERARGRATYAEVEESEADLERFRSWLAKIAARDYFSCPRRSGRPGRRRGGRRRAGRVRRRRAARRSAPEPTAPANTQRCASWKVVTGSFWWDLRDRRRQCAAAGLAGAGHRAGHCPAPRWAAARSPAAAARRAAAGPPPRRRPRPCPAGCGSGSHCCWPTSRSRST